MSSKQTTIDEEIARFLLEIDVRTLVLPKDSLPKYLQKIRNHIFEIHDSLDVDMLVRILSQIRFEAGDELDNETWDKINPLIQDALSQVSYTLKIPVIQAYGDMSEGLVRALGKVNRLRNEFAHKRPGILLREYSIDKPAGKVNIRNLFRALKNAQELFLDYAETSAACKYYQTQQFKKMQTLKKG